MAGLTGHYQRSTWTGGCVPSPPGLWHGQRFKVLQAAPLPDWKGDAPPGTMFALADGLAVATGKGALNLQEVQLAGKRPMDIAAFCRGQRDCMGSRFEMKEE